MIRKEIDLKFLVEKSGEPRGFWGMSMCVYVYIYAVSKPLNSILTKFTPNKYYGSVDLYGHETLF